MTVTNILFRQNTIIMSRFVVNICWSLTSALIHCIVLQTGAILEEGFALFQQ